MQVTMLENVKLAGKTHPMGSVVEVDETQFAALLQAGLVAKPAEPKKAEPVKEPKKG